MKTVTVVEMQSCLPETLAQRDGEPTQVTDPVVVVLPLERYQAFQAAVSEQVTIKGDITRETQTEGQHLFHLYTRRIASRLQGNEGQIKTIEITRWEKLIGVLLPWQDWQRIMTDTVQEDESYLFLLLLLIKNVYLGILKHCFAARAARECDGSVSVRVPVVICLADRFPIYIPCNMMANDFHRDLHCYIWVAGEQPKHNVTVIWGIWEFYMTVDAHPFIKVLRSVGANHKSIIIVGLCVIGGCTYGLPSPT